VLLERQCVKQYSPYTFEGWKSIVQHSTNN